MSVRLSEQDVLLPITAIEWGTPDRWSMTSRYMHMFEKDRDGLKWLNNMSISLSPGISGGRVGLGYIGILDPSPNNDFGVISEIRAVFLRTWGDPMFAYADKNYIGAEISIGMGFIHIGADTTR